MDIVRQILDETKNVIAGLLPSFSQIDYENNVALNSDRGLTKKYGFIVKEGSFVNGRSIGFTTIDQNFELFLTDTFLNKDDDAPQVNKTNELYDKMHLVLQELQKSPLALPTAGYRVLLISGLSFEAPEYINENGSVILRLNLNYQYRFKNNC